jgi:hypothetical protein
MKDTEFLLGGAAGNSLQRVVADDHIFRCPEPASDDLSALRPWPVQLNFQASAPLTLVHVKGLTIPLNVSLPCPRQCSQTSRPLAELTT